MLRRRHPCLSPKAPHDMLSAREKYITCWKIATPSLVIPLCPVSTARNRCHACRIAPPMPCYFQNMPFAITPPLYPYVNGQNAHELRTSSRARLRMTRLDFMPLTANLFQHLLTSGACLVVVTETPATTVSKTHHWKIGSNQSPRYETG